VRLDDVIYPLNSDGEPATEIECMAGQGTSQANFEPEFGQVILTEELHVLMEPTVYATPGRRWQWRGENYVSPEPPIIRRKRGEDHHYTVKMTRE
jgi:hypothetical protein